MRNTRMVPIIWAEWEWDKAYNSEEANRFCKSDRSPHPSFSVLFATLSLLYIQKTCPVSAIQGWKICLQNSKYWEWCSQDSKVATGFKISRERTLRVSSAEPFHLNTLMLIFEVWGLIKKGRCFLLKKNGNNLKLCFYCQLTNRVSAP